jgi:parallel beta-helix repeat protein
MKLAGAAFAALVLFAGAAHARTWAIRPGADAEGQLQGAMADARPGDTIALARGRYELSQSLSLNVDRVTVRGAGEDQTVLSFAGQRRGAEGLLVTSSDVTLRDFAVEDARGDAIKAQGCQGVTFHGVRAEWTRGLSSRNGRFGIYAGNCSDVLIEQSIARGASDTGIFVGQSRNIILRDNTAEGNVAGLAIENSYNTDIFNNTARRNTAGILVLDLPDQQQRAGHSARVFHNRVEGNNAPNFAAANTLASTLPAGVGVLIMGSRDVAVFDDDIGEHAAVNVVVTAYRNEFQDPDYNPLPRNIIIRNNRFGNVGFQPAGEMASVVRAGAAMPDVLWDGATTYSAGGVPHTENVRLVMRDNRSSRGGIGTFLSLGVSAAGAPFSEGEPSSAFPPLQRLDEPDAVHLRR